jgi:hypothetical protein
MSAITAAIWMNQRLRNRNASYRYTVVDFGRRADAVLRVQERLNVKSLVN